MVAFSSFSLSFVFLSVTLSKTLTSRKGHREEQINASSLLLMVLNFKFQHGATTQIQI